jgi:hypothetical protein
VGDGLEWVDSDENRACHGVNVLGGMPVLEDVEDGWVIEMGELGEVWDGFEHGGVCWEEVARGVGDGDGGVGVDDNFNFIFIVRLNSALLPLVELFHIYPYYRTSFQGHGHIY